MKKRIIIVSLLVALFSFNEADAQVSFSMSMNIGAQPVWGPVGYDHAEYYYLPDIESYYYVPRHQFVYLNAGKWVFAAALPPRYANYDLYNGYKVVINEPRPYLNYRKHREEYATYRGRHDQVIIRNSDEPRYYVVKGHPKYKGNNGNGRGNMPPGRSEGRDNREGQDRGNGHGQHGDDHGNGRGHDKHGDDHGDSHGHDHGH